MQAVRDHARARTLVKGPLTMAVVEPRSPRRY
jgi:hypothetical protein